MKSSTYSTRKAPFEGLLFYRVVGEILAGARIALT